MARRADSNAKHKTPGGSKRRTKRQNPNKRKSPITKNTFAATGFPRNAKGPVMARIARIAEDSSKFTIGKTNSKEGLSNRFSSTYKDLGYTRIQPVYASTSSNNVNKMEKQAIQSAKKRYGGKVGNKRGGGGGPDDGDGGIVYVASRPRRKRN